MVESLGDWPMEAAAALEDTGGGAGTYGGGDGDLSAVVPDDDVGFGGKLGVEVLVVVDVGDVSMPLLDEDSLVLFPMPKLESLMTGATLLIGLANS